jgi:hypothetical protein
MHKIRSLGLTRNLRPRLKSASVSISVPSTRNFPATSFHHFRVDDIPDLALLSADFWVVSVNDAVPSQIRPSEAALAHASGYELRNAFVNGIYPRSPPFLRLLANRFCECTLA